MKKINPQNKICIYLDQFVISDIIDGTNPLWLKIKELLEVNHSLGKLYCPLSVEHTLETAKKNIEGAIKHDKYFRSLSDNYLLKSDPFLTSQIISSLIRKNNFTTNTFLKTAKLKDFDEIYNQINKNNKIFDESITHRFSSQNEIRKNLKPTNNNETELILMNAIKNIERQKFIDRLKEYIKKKRIQIRPDNYGNHNFPHWIDQLLYQLTYKHSFKKKQLEQLLTELETNGFRRIPTLYIKTSLGAYLAVKNKQENTGDHIDLMRISSYLFSTDIFFTDKKRKHEICDLGLDKKYKTKVFSGVKQDLIEFIEYLENIKN
ncbi:hypothetical protein QVZ41_14160 [Wenyingzhuangia sp. chi5]|uniref:PIN domain-containing protein n=1 Tax=Wenyingzhuangia gilva TaxID=3057677 RepID=A0ABT8VVI6_9FLAO|nr:hypothetical protein [Wenyingzhuangia sp. chi5]MDO3695992.1 hypothetical protein [Wenyingzhuangia sp. chi5]